MKPVLIHIRPLDQASGERVDVRAGDGASAEVFGAAGLVWDPAIIARPQLSIELFTAQMDGKVQAGRAQFSLSLNAVTSHPRASSLYWRGSEVSIWDTDTPYSSTPAFRGHITAGTPDRDTGRIAITAEVSGAVLIDKPLLTRTFGGGGGADGDGGKRGVLKPAGFGIVKNIEPVWFDQTRNIGMIDGYGNTVSIGWLGEGRSTFGPSVGNYTNYAALAAAIDSKQVPPGRWATCLAEGMVGLGAPPSGIITVDAVFGINRVGSLMQRILRTHAGLDEERIDSAAFAALDAAVNRAVHYWTADQRNIRDLVEAIARSANASPFLTFEGEFSITRVTGGAPALELDLAGGTAPRVLNARNAVVDPPAYRLAARAARPARVLSYDEINYADDFDDTNGLFKADEVYRVGDLVWLSNGAKFLYINGTPGAGQGLPVPTFPPADPAANEYWQQILPPTKPQYLDGTPIEDWKPAAPGATPGAPDGWTIGGTLDPQTGLVTGGRPAELVLEDADNALVEQIIAAAGAILSRERDRRLLFPGGDGADVRTAFRREASARRAIAAQLVTVAAALGGVSTSVQQLMEAFTDGEEGFARFLLRAQVDSEGDPTSIVGIEGLAGAGAGVLDFIATAIRMKHPVSGEALIYFDTGAGKMIARSVEVDTLKVNTAVVPVRATATSDITGTGVGGAWQTALSASIVMAKPGVIEADFITRQGFSSGDQAWEFELLVNGVVVYATGGGRTQDSIPLDGSATVVAGTHTALVRWRAHSSVSLGNRQLRLKGYPATE
jgi:hypothetical protein